MAELKLIVPKKLPASAMPFPNAAGQQFNSWLVHLPPGHTLEDCLSPAYWAHHATKKFQLHDVIRIVAHDHSFDMQLTVVGKVVGGIRMAPWPQPAPGFGPEVGVLAFAPSPVPILANGKPAVRVDFTEVTKWRVIGLDGEPIVANLETEEEATTKLADYLKALNMRQPSEEEFAAAAKAREAREAEQAEKDAARAARRAKVR